MSMIKFNEYEVGGYIYNNYTDKVDKIKAIMIYSITKNDIDVVDDIVYLVLNQGNEATFPVAIEGLRTVYPYLGKNWDTLRLLYDKKTKSKV